MSKYICRACGYTFSAENNEPDYTQIIEEEPYELPANYVCEECGAPKTKQQRVEE